MARTKIERRVQMAPSCGGFRPVGLSPKEHRSVTISFEEYEALNLCDYEMLTQAEAAAMMNVSRPTLTRIYESARQKVAKAFVEGCSIAFEGGCVTFMDWYRCNSCGISFTDTGASPVVCPLCKTEEITKTEKS